jgi:hypothetical protein
LWLQQEMALLPPMVLLSLPQAPVAVLIQQPPLLLPPLEATVTGPLGQDEPVLQLMLPAPVQLSKMYRALWLLAPAPRPVPGLLRLRGEVAKLGAPSRWHEQLVKR